MITSQIVEMIQRQRVIRSLKSDKLIPHVKMSADMDQKALFPFLALSLCLDIRENETCLELFHPHILQAQLLLSAAPPSIVGSHLQKVCFGMLGRAGTATS